MKRIIDQLKEITYTLEERSPNHYAGYDIHELSNKYNSLVNKINQFHLQLPSGSKEKEVISELMMLL